MFIIIFFHYDIKYNHPHFKWKKICIVSKIGNGNILIIDVSCKLMLINFMYVNELEK